MRVSLALALLFPCLALGAVARAEPTRVERLYEVGGRMAVSPQGRLAFDRAAKNFRIDIWLAERPGAEPLALTAGNPRAPQHGCGQPEWHPSGEHLVFQAVDPELKSLRLLGRVTEAVLTNPGAGLQNNLWLARADGSAFWRLTNVADRGGVLHPHFSPDGKVLVWAEHMPKALGRPDNHWVLRLADFSLRDGEPVLSNMRTLRPGNLKFYEPHSFSPDGRRLLFCGCPEGREFFGLELYEIDLASGKVTRLTSDDEWDEHAHFSPDGRRIVWASSREIPQPKGKDAKLDYWIMHADGSGARRLTHFNQPGHAHFLDKGATASDVEWLPDGSAFLGFVQIMGRRPFSPVMRITP